MFYKIKATRCQFIDAEPCLSKKDEKVTVLSFQGRNDKIVDIALNLKDTEDLVQNALAVLAAHGDEHAAEIREKYMES